MCLHDDAGPNKRHHCSPHSGNHVVRGEQVAIYSTNLVGIIHNNRLLFLFLIWSRHYALFSIIATTLLSNYQHWLVATDSTQFILTAIAVSIPETVRDCDKIMAPISSFTEPIIRAVRNLTSAFLSRSIATTTTDPRSYHDINKRAPQILSIPATYAERDSSPEPGVVVGIVLGVVAAVVLVLFVLYKGLGLGGDSKGSISGGGSVIVVEEEESVRGGPRRGGTVRSRSNRGGRGRVMEEIVEVRSRPHSRRETEDEYSEDVVEVIEESSATPYDEVEVEEEDESSVATSPPRRKRTSGGGSYRRVDPLAYGDDDEPYRRRR